MAQAKHFSVRLGDQRVAALQGMADQDDRSIGYLIKIAVDQYIKRRQEDDAPKRMKRA